MANNKLNTDPKDNKPLESALPPGVSDPPAPAATKILNNLSEHEQAMIPGMGENAPAGKVIDLSDIKTAVDQKDKASTTPDVTAKPLKATPAQKCRGRLPKKQAGVSAGKKQRSPSQVARLRLTRRPVTKCPEGRKLSRSGKRAPAVHLCLNPLRR